MQKKKKRNGREERGKKYAIFVPLLLTLDILSTGGDFNGEPRVVQRRRLELLLPSMERSQTDYTNDRTLRSNKYTYKNFLNPIKALFWYLVFNKKILIVIWTHNCLFLNRIKNLQYLQIKNSRILQIFYI